VIDELLREISVEESGAGRRRMDAVVR
jgi:hypothetical protein